MEAKDRNPPDAVRAPAPEELARDAAQYEYLQLLRMLRLLGVRLDDVGSSRGVRTQPSLTLSTQPGEVASARNLGEGRWSITTHVFGLYGPGSPLPVYYTEELLDERREGRHTTRGLIDLLHHTLYPLLFRCWEKYRIAQRVVEERDARLLKTLQSFAGRVPKRRDAPRQGAPLPPLLHLALLQQGPRSAAGLSRLLAIGLRPARIRVLQHECRLMPIPLGQRSALGMRNHRLGCDTRVGNRIDDASGTLRVDVEDLHPRRFRQLLPGGSRRAHLESLLALYLRDPLRVDLYLRPRASACPPSPGLGAKTRPRLGVNTWLGAGGKAPAAVYAGFWEAQAPDRADTSGGSEHA
jgi:type VI secretion system protein ImpH